MDDEVNASVSSNSVATQSSSVVPSESTGTASSAPELPFLEKYRPKRLDDVVGNADTVSRLKIIAQQGNMPHLIISGPPGTGKTTSIHCLAHEMLGSAYADAVLEMNASDARSVLSLLHHSAFSSSSVATLVVSTLSETKSSNLHRRRLLFPEASIRSSSSTKRTR